MRAKPIASTKKTLYKCTALGCDSAFQSAKSRKLHLNGVHSLRVSCPHEDCRAMVKKRNLARHISTVHQREKSKCANCGTRVLKASLWQHTRRCTNDGSVEHECPVQGCPAKFTNLRNLTSHRHRIHKPPIKCLYQGCGVTVKFANYYRHVKARHTKVEGLCDQCGQMFLRNNLNRHIQRCLRSRNALGRAGSRRGRRPMKNQEDSSSEENSSSSEEDSESSESGCSCSCSDDSESSSSDSESSSSDLE